MLVKIMKFVENVAWVVITMSLLVIGITFLPIEGIFKIFTVQSGSMEPEIHTGSLIFVRPMPEYNIGDVVTRATSDPKVTITHRIVAKENTDGKTLFETKGDANEDVDGELVDQSNIIGRKIMTIPYIGYPIGFARTLQGFILLIIIPAVIIIYEEIKNIKDELVKIYKRKKESSSECNIMKERYSYSPENSFPEKTAFENIKIVPKNIIRSNRRMDL